jgi:chitinase
VLDQQADVPFAYKGRQWVSYEDEQSIALKSQWIRKNDFGGAMIFSLNQDDWKGICPTTSEPFPLVGIVYRIITNGSKEEASEGPPSPLKDNLPLLK